MEITEEVSIRKGKLILKKKGLLAECLEIALFWSKLSKGNREKRLEELGWRTEYEFSVGQLRPRFDAFKSRVGLEHERRQQMNVRSHLLMTEVAYWEGIIDACVFIIPAGRDASVERTERELKGELFTHYFPLQVPLYLIEYGKSQTPKPKEKKRTKLLHRESWERRLEWANPSTRNVAKELIDRIADTFPNNTQLTKRGQYYFYKGEETTLKSKFAVLLLTKKEVKVRIGVDFEEFKDPRDISKKHKGWFYKRREDVGFAISKPEQIGYALKLIEQSYDLAK